MESIAGSVAGSLVGGLFGNEGGESTSSREPWGPAQPYLLGADGITGVLPSAAGLYDQSQWTPEMHQYYLQQIQRLANTTNDDFYNDIVGGSKAIMQGQYDPAVRRVANIHGVQDIQPGSVTPQSVNLQQTLAQMGGLDPTSSIQNLLSGTVNNPYLRNQADSIVNDLTRNTLENVMPSIRSGAVANGYGSSRQGIAEGLAASRLNQDVSSALANLYGGAYESAQNRMMGTANGLTNLGLSNEQANANRSLQGQQFNTSLDYNAQAQNNANTLNTQQFNANLGLQNNNQAIANSQAQINNRMNGMSLMNNGWNMYNNQYNNMMNTLAYPNNYGWNNLNNYANIVNSVAGQGGVTTGDRNGSTLGNMFGGAMMGNSIMNNLGGNSWQPAVGVGQGFTANWASLPSTIW